MTFVIIGDWYIVVVEIQAQYVYVGNYSFHYSNRPWCSIAMNLINPQIQACAEAMMSFSLFISEPKDILIAGGNNSLLPIFCTQCFPDAIVTILEMDKNTLAMRNEEAASSNLDNLHVINADAGIYLGRKSNAVDVILLDVYSKKTVPAPLMRQFFYDGCHLALREKGIVVANFTGDLKRTAACRVYLRDTFERQAYRMLTKGGENLISLALKGMPILDLLDMNKRVQEVKKKIGLDLFFYLEQMQQLCQQSQLQNVQ